MTYNYFDEEFVNGECVYETEYDVPHGKTLILSEEAEFDIRVFGAYRHIEIYGVNAVRIKSEEDERSLIFLRVDPLQVETPALLAEIRIPQNARVTFRPEYRITDEHYMACIQVF